MAIIVSDIRDQFPEFKLVPDDFIQEKLDEAEQEIDRTEWGEDNADIGVKYLTAHKITVSPKSGMARLINEKTESTIYLQHYEKVKRQTIIVFNVI